MNEDFWLGWFAGFGGLMIGWIFAELTIWMRHAREILWIRNVERLLPGMIEIQRGIQK